MVSNWWLEPEASPEPIRKPPEKVEPGCQDGQHDSPSNVHTQIGHRLENCLRQEHLITWRLHGLGTDGREAIVDVFGLIGLAYAAEGLGFAVQDRNEDRA